MPLFLLTNDDGIEAKGLRSLEEALQGLGEILVVAPDRERSAVSHGLTIHEPLELKEVGPGRYTLNGTPADCVIQALVKLTATPPDLVLSGINHGANLGDDIMYSGTVAAAREASRRRVPAVAVSQAYDDRPIDFRRGVKFVRSLVQALLEQKLLDGLCLNVNIPVRRFKGVKITRQGCSPHFPHFNSLDRYSDRGLLPDSDGNPGRSKIPLDFEAVVGRYVSITPLQRDQTDYSAVARLEDGSSRLFKGFRVPGIGLIGLGN